MTASENATFEKVREIIVETTGVKPQTVAMTSDLCEDFGVAGDDADVLFMAFDVVWADLDLGVHFGSEGWGMPFPWQLDGHHEMYESQPCKVADIVEAVEAGRWKGTKLVPLSSGLRKFRYFQSVFPLVVILAFVILGVWSVYRWLAG